MKNIVYEITDGCLILAHGEGPPTDEEWKQYIEVLARHFDEQVKVRILIVSGGGAPTPGQRAVMDKRFKREMHRARVALMTHSTFVRGVLKAFSLFSPVYRGFDLEDLDGALAHLGQSEAPGDRIRRITATLQLDVSRR